MESSVRHPILNFLSLTMESWASGTEIRFESFQNTRNYKLIMTDNRDGKKHGYLANGIDRGGGSLGRNGTED